MVRLAISVEEFEARALTVPLCYVAYPTRPCVGRFHAPKIAT
jgi:hypothetical protein